MESRIRPMASTRARLLAAAILGGACAGPLAAQPPRDTVFAAQSFEVLPPRRLPMTNVPSAFNSQNVTVGFFSSTPPPSPPPQPPTANVPNAAVPAGPTSWLNPPRGVVAPNAQGPTLMPLFGRPQVQGTLPQQFPATTAPAQAPAWRWHGYGTVNNGNVAPAVPAAAPAGTANPGLVTPDAPPIITLPMPTAVPMPMPPGPSLAPDSRLPGAMPSFMPSSGPVEAVPLPNSA